MNRLSFCLLDVTRAAKDWMNPSAVLEAYEARAARMIVSCAKNLNNFANSEDGTNSSRLSSLLIMPKFTEVSFTLIYYPFNLSFFSAGFAELSSDLVEAAVAHCQVIVVSK